MSDDKNSSEKLTKSRSDNHVGRIYKNQNSSDFGQAQLESSRSLKTLPTIISNRRCSSSSSSPSPLIIHEEPNQNQLKKH